NDLTVKTAMDKAFESVGLTRESNVAVATAGTHTAFTAGTAATAATALVTELNELAKAKVEMDAIQKGYAEVNSERALQDGDLVINGVSIRASSALDDTASDTNALASDGSGSAIAIAAAINASYESTGVKANINATEFVGKSS